MKRYHCADNGYKFDRFIFWGVMGIMFLIIGGLLVSNDFSFKYNFYLKCDNPLGCENPLAAEGASYHNSFFTSWDYLDDCTDEWCKAKILKPGVYGRSPNPLIKNFFIICIMLMGLGLVVNHYIHNRGKKFAVRLAVSDKIWKRLKKIKIEDDSPLEVYHDEEDN